jgi:phosphoribosylglycinamide formyltransferase-1
MRLAIVGSTRGTDMLALIAAITQKELAASIEVVISNKADAMILERARRHALNAVFVDPKNLSREEFDKKLSQELQVHQVDLIILIGYMRILSNQFVSDWRGKIINVHPSLLPAFAGGMDQNVHQAVIDAREKMSGCTVHFVTEEVDGGPILIQKKCAVSAQDTAATLKDRVQDLEGLALIEAVNMIAEQKKVIRNESR